MGAQMVYLPKPVTSKENEDGGDFGKSGLQYGVTGMQGWRRNMEDSHLAVTELEDKVSMFGVFDGHGGRGVSRFAAKRLPALLRETEAYKQGDYARALETAFLSIDDLLREAAGRKEIEDLDRPDAGAPTHRMAVPRRVLQRFLGTGGSLDDDDKETEEPEEEEEEEQENGTGGGRSGGGAGGAAAEVATSGPHCEQGAAKEQEVKEAAEPEAAEGEGEDWVRIADDDDDDGDGAEGEGEGGEDVEAEVVLEGDEWAGEDMTLVDPARLTRDPTPEAQGCTAVVVLVVRREEGGHGPRVICANAGDSRAIMSRMGQVIALSEDHKPENPGETARITKAGGFVQHMPGGARVQGDLNLSRAMGDLRYKKPENLPPEEQIVTAFPEIRTYPLTDEDEFLVLGCDGIWERCGNQEMVDFVRPRLTAGADNGKAGPLSQICGEICDKGLCPSMDAAENEGFDGTGCDNMTVVIVKLKREIVGEARKRPADDAAEGASKEAEVGKRPKLADRGAGGAAVDENLPR